MLVALYGAILFVDGWMDGWMDGPPVPLPPAITSPGSNYREFGAETDSNCGGIYATLAPVGFLRGLDLRRMPSRAVGAAGQDHLTGFRRRRDSVRNAREPPRIRHGRHHSRMERRKSRIIGQDRDSPPPSLPPSL